MLGKSKAGIGTSANIIWKCTSTKSIHKDNVKACFLRKARAQPFFFRERVCQYSFVEGNAITFGFVQIYFLFR